MVNIIKPGLPVYWRGRWGLDQPKKVTIKSIEFVPNGGKYGVSVDEVSTENKDQCIFQFNENTHWAYGHQVDLVYL